MKSQRITEKNSEDAIFQEMSKRRYVNGVAEDAFAQRSKSHLNSGDDTKLAIDIFPCIGGHPANKKSHEDNGDPAYSDVK